MAAVIGLLAVLASAAGGAAWSVAAGGSPGVDVAGRRTAVVPPRGAGAEPAATSVGSAPSGRPHPAGVLVDSPDQVWRTRLIGLDRTRAAAYARGDIHLLGQVYVPGSRLTADRVRLGDLVRRGFTVSGVRHDFVVVAAVAVTDRSVRLRVRQRLRRWELHADGRVVAVSPAGRPTMVVTELVATADGWRLR